MILNEITRRLKRTLRNTQAKRLKKKIFGYLLAYRQASVEDIQKRFKLTPKQVRMIINELKLNKNHLGAQQ